MPKTIRGYHVYEHGGGRVEVKNNTESWVFEVNKDDEEEDEIQFLTYFEKGEEKPCSNYHEQEEIVRMAINDKF